MNELTPLQEEIRKILTRMKQEEPYITNAAIRISILTPQDVQRADKDYKSKDYARGYQAGYHAANNRNKRKQQS